MYVKHILTLMTPTCAQDSKSMIVQAGGNACGRIRQQCGQSKTILHASMDAVVGVAPADLAPRLH